MIEAKVKYALIDHWRDEKGFGFIRASSGPDVFVHVTRVRGKKLSEYEWIQYETQPSKRKAGGVEAINVVPFKVATQDELAAIIQDAGLYVTAGQQALDLLEAERKVDALKSCYPLFSESLARGEHQDWMSLTEGFYRKGEQAMFKAMIAVFESDPALLDSELHLDCWTQALPVAEPSAEVFAAKLNQGFALPLEEKNGYSMHVGTRREWYQRFEPETFLEVFEQVSAYRVKVDAGAWLKELKELAGSLEDASKKEFVQKRLRVILDDQLTAMERIELAVRDGIGEFNKEEWVQCWSDFDQDLWSFVQHYSSVPVDFLKEVFLDVVEIHPLDEALVRRWMKWLRDYEDWQAVVEKRLTDDDSELWMWMWEKELVNQLSTGVFKLFIGDASENRLLLLNENISRLDPSVHGQAVVEVVESLPELSQYEEFVFLKSVLELGRTLGASGERFDPLVQLVLVDVEAVEVWAKTEDVAWIGLPAIEPVLAYLEEATHAQVARKFFLHVEQGVVPVASSDFDGMVALGCSQRVPFAERMVWKQIASLMKDGSWLRFDDVVAEFVQRPDGWPSKRENPWPLLDQCKGRAKRKFRTGGVSGQNWEYADRYIDLVSDPDRILVYTQYEDRHAVKSMPGIRWSTDERLWFTTHANKDAALAVAREMGLLIRDQGDFWENNRHVSYIERVDDPLKVGRHCLRCEGRRAYKRGSDELSDRSWCRAGFCDAPTTESKMKWDERTLRGFLEILDVDMDDIDTKGRRVERGQYDRLCGSINRFIQVYPHLTCGFVPRSLGNEGMESCSKLDESFASGCGKVMSPHSQSHYSHYRITHFACDEEGCQHRGREVYLHHCLDKECNEVIDSRFSAQCPNNWYICRGCDSCCSDETKQRRSKYLYEVGGVTETDDTIRYQSSWQGHKEKGEYFCACCGGKMVTTWSKEESHWGRVKKVRSSHCLACKPKEDSGSSNVEDDGLGDFPF